MNPPLSMIPFLFAAQLAFLLAIALRTRSARAIASAGLIAAALSAWGYGITIMAQAGAFDSAAVLRLLPGLWLPVVPFLLLFTLAALPFVRAGLISIAAGTADHWFVGIQALRIAALGTLIKTVHGDFPLEVELAIGLTDLAFGLSALWLFFRVKRGAVSADALVLWNIVGVLLILIPGGVALQSGLPGPLRVFTDAPTSEVMLDWPMVLAPGLVVPAFLLLNLLAAFAAHCSRRTMAT
ncbi:hypothetical protein [Litoreibacter roseus]|uniref:Uncharacterized protein n=1 Tax=Litoreibacter roseus TaxID=2601869 RepID=A0A6N6JJ76_9RHOB|nr:hypothetical protein [Litoreibacter roseus]GFE65880.1 hypothetical protein KIN_29540 [Litoreibacter roseus]